MKKNKLIKEIEQLQTLDICKNVKCLEQPYTDCNDCFQNLLIDKAITIIEQNSN